LFNPELLLGPLSPWQWLILKMGLLRAMALTMAAQTLVGRLLELTIAAQILIGR